MAALLVLAPLLLAEPSLSSSVHLERGERVNRQAVNLAAPLPSSLECDGTEDCGKYHYCQRRLFYSKCVTNIRGTGKKCLGRRGNPDHGKCDQSRFSVQRCFVENGHRCANAYFMPCSPGDPEGCPKNFVCTFQQYGHIMATVCKPVPMPYTKRCKADFECGYNEGIGSWDKCYKGGCQRIIVD